MPQSYICNTPKKTIGRSGLDLNAKKCPHFNKNDILYLSDPEQTIHSRWVVTKTGKNLISLTKKPSMSVFVPKSELADGPYAEKYSKLTDRDADFLEKNFKHRLKIFPSYDYHSDNAETNLVSQALKKLDPKIEVYFDAYYTDDLINDRLDGPYSIAIHDHYGLITFKCLEQDPLSDPNLKNRFSNQLRYDNFYDLLTHSPQLTDTALNLTIGYTTALIYETDNPNILQNLNQELQQRGSHLRVFTCETFIDFIQEISDRRKVVDDIKHIGIVQSLLPKYVNSKTVDLVNEPLKFIPDDTFELDDLQKEVLRHLNQRAYIKASAGSGKTILLLAKAYEVAAANPQKNFLILCYNNKLAEDIQNQATNTGRNIKNLRISTFDKFLIDERISYNSDNRNDAWAARQKSFVEQVLNHKLNYSFGGIFVDEMQQMKEDWLTALLECTDEQKYMIVAGDYQQSINPGLLQDDSTDDDFVEVGDISNFYISDRRFDTYVLDKNYRNTKSVAKVLDKMVSLIRSSSEELEIPQKQESQILAHSHKKIGSAPVLVKTQPGNAEERLIVDQVRNLIEEEDYNPSEILLISPLGAQTTSGIVSQLRRSYEVRNFVGGKNHDRISASGIKVGTIGKSIGLDFKVVILYDICKLQTLLKLDSPCIQDISSLKHENRRTRRAYLSALRNIYVACSRAREKLIVIDDSTSENLITEFLKKSGLKEEV